MIRSFHSNASISAGPSRLALAKSTSRGETAIRSVEPDSDLAPGTCRLDSGGLSVEIGLSAQIDVLESLLLRERSGEVTAPLVTPASSDRSTP